MFVPFLVEIRGLIITTRKKRIDSPRPTYLLREKIHFKSITTTPKTPHPHNVHLTLCIEKLICGSSLTKFEGQHPFPPLSHKTAIGRLGVGGGGNVLAMAIFRGRSGIFVLKLKNGPSFN